MSIDTLVKKINKEIDSKILRPLAELEPIDPIPFGIPTLDELTGIGGVPRGRITELYGTESSGKSSLCLSLVAEAQKLGLLCAFIDMEMALTKELATKFGIDMKQLIYSEPDTGEEALQVISELMENEVKLIIVDSVSRLTPEDELEADFDEHSIGLQARLVSKGMRKLIPPAFRHNVALVFINQLRDDIGKMGFGPKTTTSGGRALRYYSSLRLKVARKDWLKKGDATVGMTVVVSSEKNKMAPPRLNTEMEFFFEDGFDRVGNLLTHLVNTKVVTELAKTYYHGDKEIGKAKEAIEYIKKNYDYKTRQLRSEPSTNTK